MTVSHLPRFFDSLSITYPYVENEARMDIHRVSYLERIDGIYMDILFSKTDRYLNFYILEQFYIYQLSNF